MSHASGILEGMRKPKGVRAAVAHARQAIKDRITYWQNLPDEPPHAPGYATRKESVVQNLDHAWWLFDGVVWEFEQEDKAMAHASGTPEDGAMTEHTGRQILWTLRWLLCMLGFLIGVMLDK